MATRRLYFHLAKTFRADEITSILGELSILETLGFAFSDKENFRSQILSARNTICLDNNFQKLSKNFSEKAIRNLLNECGILYLKNNGILLEIIPIRPIGCYILRKKENGEFTNTFYSNPIKMFDDIRNMKDFKFDISIIQKRITQSISDNAVLDFAKCRNDFEFAKVVSESLVPFEYGVKFISANEILQKEIEVIVANTDNNIENFSLYYIGHLDMYAASILVKNTPENLSGVKKLITKFGWNQITHFWVTEPLEEVLARLNI